MTSRLGSAAKGAAFGLVLAVAPRPLRRWMLTMLALGIGIIYTIGDVPEYDPGTGPYSEAAFLANREAQRAWGGIGTFPWYCQAMMIAFVVWGIFGYIRAWRLVRLYRAQQWAAGNTLSQRVRAFTNSRVIIAVDGTQRPPQGSTGPPPVPTAPPPQPRSTPPGSNLPAVWVPTYSGSAKPVQRVETTLGGTVTRDRRRVDPDGL